MRLALVTGPKNPHSNCVTQAPQVPLPSPLSAYLYDDGRVHLPASLSPAQTLALSACVRESLSIVEVYEQAEGVAPIARALNTVSADPTPLLPYPIAPFLALHASSCGVLTHKQCMFVVQALLKWSDSTTLDPSRPTMTIEASGNGSVIPSPGDAFNSTSGTVDHCLGIMCCLMILLMSESIVYQPYHEAIMT